MKMCIRFSFAQIGRESGFLNMIVSHDSGSVLDGLRVKCKEAHIEGLTYKSTSARTTS